MNESSLWLVLAGIVLISELTTGTFYLLMVSLGALIGALLAFIGQPLEIQIAGASVVAVFACLLLQRIRQYSGQGASSKTDKLDIGNTVNVELWGADCTSRVQYRGAAWAAESIDELPQIGQHVIVDVKGSTLVLKATQFASF